jgi:hypothetical protein
MATCPNGHEQPGRPALLRRVRQPIVASPETPSADAGAGVVTPRAEPVAYLVAYTCGVAAKVAQVPGTPLS